MSTTATQDIAAKPTNDTSQEALNTAAKNTAAKQKAQEEKEYGLIVSLQSELTKAFQATGLNVLQRLAREVGSSVSKLGRPGEIEYGRFEGALLARKEDFAQQDRLFRLAQKSVPQGSMSKEEHQKAMDRFVASKSRAGDGKASCTLRMSKPAQHAIKLGE